MIDARWTEIDDVAAACLHFANAAGLFDGGGFEDPGLAGYRNRMAPMHARQAGHTSLESAPKRVLERLGEEAPRGEQSADPVRRVSRPLDIPGPARPALLSPDVARDVDESRRFRHRAAHDDNFEPHRASPSIEAAGCQAVSLGPCLATFRDRIDPADPAAGPTGAGRRSKPGSPR